MARRCWALAGALVLLLTTLGMSSQAAGSVAGSLPPPYLVKGGLSGSPFADGQLSIGERTFWMRRTPDGDDTELWVSDGTAAGTKELFDPWPGGSANVAGLVRFKAGMVFTADDGVHGIELWYSDGSATGTRRVTDVNRDQWGMQIQAATAGAVFFSADDGTHGDELYRWTATAGPELLEINTTARSVTVPLCCTTWDPLWAGAHPTALSTIGETVIFTANNNLITPWKHPVTGEWYPSAPRGNGRELWRVGTTGRPTLVKDITTTGLWGVPDASASTRFDVTAGRAVLNGAVYFVVEGSAEGDTSTRAELWRSDGTAAGTVRVSRSLPIGYDVDKESWRFEPVVAGGKLYYPSATEAGGYGGLWATTGSGAGARVSPVGQADSPTAVGDKVVFSLRQPSTGSEPWVSDGTSSTLLKDIWPGAGSSVPGPYAPWGGHVYSTGLQDQGVVETSTAPTARQPGRFSSTTSPRQQRARSSTSSSSSGVPSACTSSGSP